MKIISNPTGSIFMEKTAASLECTGESNPAPTYSWSVKGENITDINQTEWIISDDKKTISKESVSMSDNGLAFTCKAENKFGSVDTSLAITVNEQPTTTAA